MIISCCLLFSSGYWNTFKLPHVPILEASYVGLHKFFWTLGFLSFITVVSGKFSYHKYWYILSKIHMSLFVFHTASIHYNIFTSRNMMSFRIPDMIMTGVIQTIIAYICSILFYLMFDAPLKKLSTVFRIKTGKEKIS